MPGRVGMSALGCAVASRAEARAMTLAFRRAAPDDYDVIQAGEIVGRIYRSRVALALDDQVVGAA